MTAAAALVTIGTAPPTSELRCIDVEDLLQWAMARAIEPRLRVPSARELSLNPYTVRPKGYANNLNRGGVGIEGGRPAEDIDAERVLRAIDRLDPWTASIVRVNAKARHRPDWFEGVEPKLGDRPSPTTRGLRHKWCKARVTQPQNRYCACGRVAEMAGHIIRHRGNSRLFWRRADWQPRTYSCDRRKTAVGDSHWA